MIKKMFFCWTLCSFFFVYTANRRMNNNLDDLLDIEFFLDTRINHVHFGDQRAQIVQQMSRVAPMRRQEQKIMIGGIAVALDEEQQQLRGRDLVYDVLIKIDGISEDIGNNVPTDEQMTLLIQELKRLDCVRLQGLCDLLYQHIAQLNIPKKKDEPLSPDAQSIKQQLVDTVSYLNFGSHLDALATQISVQSKKNQHALFDLLRQLDDAYMRYRQTHEKHEMTYIVSREPMLAARVPVILQII